MTLVPLYSAATATVLILPHYHTTILPIVLVYYNYSDAIQLSKVLLHERHAPRRGNAGPLERGGEAHIQRASCAPRPLLKISPPIAFSQEKNGHHLGVHRALRGLILTK